MKATLTRAARADRRTILDYVAERSPTGARAVLLALDDVFDLIADHPDIGASTRRPGIRTVTVSRYPYRVFYRATPGRISVLHIRHTSRLPWTGSEIP